MLRDLEPILEVEARGCHWHECKDGLVAHLLLVEDMENWIDSETLAFGEFGCEELCDEVFHLDKVWVQLVCFIGCGDVDSLHEVLERRGFPLDLESECHLD